MGKTSSFKADSLSITPQIPEIEADTVTCNPLRTHLLGFPYEKKKKKNNWKNSEEGKDGCCPECTWPYIFSIAEGPWGQGSEWWRKWSSWNSQRLCVSLRGDERGQRSQRVTDLCEWHQCPVMHKPSQQVAGQSWVLAIAGSVRHLGTRSSCLHILLSFFYLLINLRSFRRAILMADQCMNISGDHKEPDSQQA